MSRNPKIEAILAAKYDAVNCDPAQRAEKYVHLNALLDEIVGLMDGKANRQMVLNNLHGHYVEFCKARRQEEDALRQNIR